MQAADLKKYFRIVLLLVTVSGLFTAANAVAYPFWGEVKKESLLDDLVNPDTAQNYFNSRDPHIPYLKARQAIQGESEQSFLRFYAQYYENADSRIAADAYWRSTLIPFEILRDSLDVFPLPKMRRWLRDQKIPQMRRDFYAFILGLKKRPEDRPLLAEVIDQHLSLSNLHDLPMVGALAGYAVSGSHYAQPMFLKIINSVDRFGNTSLQHAQDALTVLVFLRSELPSSIEGWSSSILRAALAKSNPLQLRAIEIAQQWSDPVLVAHLIDHLKKESATLELKSAAKSYCQIIEDERCKPIIVWIDEDARRKSELKSKGETIAH